MLKEGQILDQKYRIGRLLGRGGMGSVFEAEHLRIKRQVAIKLLNRESADEENLKRFEREAEAAGRIGSDHIVEVLDFGTTPDGDRFMVMELMNGEPFKARLSGRPPLSPAELVPLATQVLEGLGAAHDAGIVHRDLKPDNIFILREKAGHKDFVKILDFGISKFSALSSESGQMTKTGAVMGTPFYMSPEQAKSANEADGRSDLYSLGVVMYEAVTGVKPFSGTTLTELIFKIAFEDPPHPCQVVPSLDRSFAELVLKTMAREPSDRFQSAAELKSALLAWQRGERPGTPTKQGFHKTTEMMIPASGPSSAAVTYQQRPTQPAPLSQAGPPQFAPAAPPTRPQPPTMVSAIAPHMAPSALPFAAQTGPRLPPTIVGVPPSAPMAAAPSLDTQKSWNQPPPPTAKSGARAYVVVAIALLGLCGAAVIVVLSRGPATAAKAGSATTAEATAPDATATEVATAATSSAAQATIPTATATTTPTAVPASAEPSATPTAAAGGPATGGASTLRTPTQARAPTAPPPPRATTTAPPSKTVGDLGY